MPVLSRIAVAAVVALSCPIAARAHAQSAAHPPDLRRWDITLANVRYHILLPQHATVTTRADRFSASLSKRLVRQLHLTPAPRGVAAAYARAERLSNGAVLRYNVDYDVGGGSGGTEGLIEGALEIGTHVLAVTCHDQREISAPRPEWCLQYLRYLTLQQGR
jgi:hypothetical protein